MDEEIQELIQTYQRGLNEGDLDVQGARWPHSTSSIRIS